MKRARRIAWATVAAASVAALVAACGLPTDSEPREIALDRIPPDLLASTTTGPDDAQAGGSSVDVYLVDGDRLRAVDRRLTEVTPRAVLEQLLRGKVEGDPASAISVIPQNTELVEVTQEGTVVTVTLTDQIVNNVTGPDQKNAFAQLVFTLTGLEGVEGVTFRYRDTDGVVKDLTPQTDTGATNRPLTRSDYSSVTPLN